MKTTSKSIIFVTILLLMILCGCGIIGLKQIPHKNAETWRTFDPNDYGIEIQREENGSVSYTWSMDATLNEDMNIMPYWNPWGDVIGVPSVKGYLNENPYPVIFDTGCNPLLILGEKIVIENDLAVYFFNPQDIQNSGGLVIADSLQIGSLELIDFPCGLWEHRAQFEVLGVPIYKPEIMIMPLVMMRKFNYFKFDDIQKEISFSEISSFVPENTSEWLSLPLKFDGLYLLLDVPIEGIDTELRLDTGAGYQMKLDISVIEKLFETRPDFEKAWKNTTYLYGPYEGGKSTEKKFTAKNLQFDGLKLDRVKIIYSNTDQDEQCHGVIGAELFKKTIMVLDFENNLMWVKKAKNSRFE